MTKEVEPQSQEFTLPFVGREEELQFLWNEYDQMLHAQYRSVWIEAPAGMGKTTLVEEFLRRITGETSEVLKTSEVLQPWIVHAHLRERSSNSLASFVEALGITLQTLTEAQQEKLFSKLTSFYQERARKIVGEGNVQTMEMEEAITTAGYILKRLSAYYPVVIILEDIHVLKGQISFYALRHLLAIVAHVPVFMMFISRPSEEKEIKLFHEQLLKEGCKKVTVGGLKQQDVKNLTAHFGLKISDAEVLRYSGGNALLLREIIRAGRQMPEFDMKKLKQDGNVTETIISFLTEELQKLSKKDRQVVSIAGMLGEEFSEQLLNEITESKDFKCWTPEVLQRLEHLGITRRRRKTLTPKEEGKEISLRISVFSHALWWEAARKLYQEEKKMAKWSDKKFGETIVPLLSHESYPLLTDAELIVNLFHWLPLKRSLPLLQYVNGICGVWTRWHFHSHDEHLAILTQAHSSIQNLLNTSWFRLDTTTMDIMVELLNAEISLTKAKRKTIQKAFNNYFLIRRLLSGFLKNDRGVFKHMIQVVLDESVGNILQYADEDGIEKTSKRLKSLEKLMPDECTHDDQKYYYASFDGVRGLREWFRDPEKSTVFFYCRLKKLSFKNGKHQNERSTTLSLVSRLAVSQQTVEKWLSLITKYRKVIPAIEVDESSLSKVYRAEIELCLRAGLITTAATLVPRLRELYERNWKVDMRFLHSSTMLNVWAYMSEEKKAHELLNKIFSDSLASRDEAILFKELAKKLFYLEEWKEFEKLWEANKQNIHPYEMHQVVPLLESRIFICLLLGNNDGVHEAVPMLKGLPSIYPMMKNTVNTVMKRLDIFLALEKKLIGGVKKEFDKFLADDDTLSPFDKAHYAQLFARIGVRYGHNPKQFESYIRNSLREFTRLDLPKRVVFTAEKFYECKLLSKKELERIIHIHKDATLEEKKGNKQTSATENVVEPQVPAPERGITLRCLGRMAAVGSDGNEIIAGRWGKRISVPSHHKRIVVELVCARLERRCVERRKLLEALFPEIERGTVSEQKIARLDRTLSVRLSQLKQSFLPYEIFDKTDEGYRLHPSVHVDILEIQQVVAQAKMLARVHAPSARWLFYKAKNLLERGDFANGFSGPRIKVLRQRMESLLQECTTLLGALERAEIE